VPDINTIDLSNLPLKKQPPATRGKNIIFSRSCWSEK